MLLITCLFLNVFNTQRVYRNAFDNILMDRYCFRTHDKNEFIFIKHLCEQAILFALNLYSVIYIKFDYLTQIKNHNLF